MSKRNPKSIGSDFEREMSKALSLWWTEGKRDDVIWRSDTSGGRATQKFKRGKILEGHFGDFTYRDPIAKPLFDYCVIEAKKGYTNNLNPFNMFDSKSLLFEFWEKLLKDTEKCGREESLLIFRRTFHKALIVMSCQLWQNLWYWNGVFTAKRIMIHNGDTNLVVLELKEFFKYVSPDTFIRPKERLQI